MKSKHIEKANELYEQLDEYVETVCSASSEDRSVHEVAEEFY
jgi:hypothetical protein